MFTHKIMKYSSIAFQLTRDCNANCKICCQSSKPLLNEKIDTEIILKSINAIKDVANVKSISITGGEPFLYPDDVLSIAKCCKQNGRQFTIITNAFWCGSYAQTFDILSILKENSLNTCFVSVDKFHQEFIHIECIKNMLRACRELRIPVKIQASVTKSTFADTDEIIKSISDDKLNTLVLWTPVYPVGGAKAHFGQGDFYTTKLNNPRCQYHNVLLVLSDGRVQPCCSPCFGIPLDYGNVYTDSLDKILKIAYENELMREIASEGFERLIKEAKEEFGFTELDAYVDACHLCNHLLGDPERYAFLMEKSRSWRLQEERVTAVIRQFVGM